MGTSLFKSQVNTHYVVDMSYIVFYSGFSAFNNYVRNFDVRKNQLHPKFDPTLDEEFCAIFINSLIYNIRRPIQQINPFIDTSRVILCTDCARKNIWRRGYYPDYKMNRDTKDTSKDEFDFGAVFRYAKEMAIPHVCDEFGCVKVSCDCAEGDDVIAIITRKLLDEHDKNRVIIISSDRDMLQLYHDRVTIITAQGETRTPPKDMSKLAKTNIDDSFTAEDFLMVKILTGDGSDNIPNVKPGIGIKKALSLVQNKDKLKKLLLEDTIARDGFKRNKKLISMKEIPPEVAELILEDYQRALVSRDE